MVKLKLQVLLVPQDYADSMTSDLNRLSTRRFLHLSAPGTTLLQVQEEVCVRFKKLYPYESDLVINGLQDNEICDLDPEYLLEDVFNPGDILRVIVLNVFGPKDSPFNNSSSMIQSTPLPAAPTLYDQSMSRKRSPDYFETKDSQIPTKLARLAQPQTPLVVNKTRGRSPLAADESNVSLPAPEDHPNLSIPIKQSEARAPQKQRITSGMLTMPAHAKKGEYTKIDRSPPPSILSSSTISSSDDEPILTGSPERSYSPSKYKPAANAPLSDSSQSEANENSEANDTVSKVEILDMFKKANPQTDLKFNNLMKNLSIDMVESHIYATSTKRAASERASSRLLRRRPPRRTSTTQENEEEKEVLNAEEEERKKEVKEKEIKEKELKEKEIKEKELKEKELKEKELKEKEQKEIREVEKKKKDDIRKEREAVRIEKLLKKRHEAEEIARRKEEAAEARKKKQEETARLKQAAEEARIAKRAEAKRKQEENRLQKEEAKKRQEENKRMRDEAKRKADEERKRLVERKTHEWKLHGVSIEEIYKRIEQLAKSLSSGKDILISSPSYSPQPDKQETDKAQVEKAPQQEKAPQHVQQVQQQTATPFAAQSVSNLAQNAFNPGTNVLPLKNYPYLAVNSPPTNNVSAPVVKAPPILSSAPAAARALPAVRAPEAENASIGLVKENENIGNKTSPSLSKGNPRLVNLLTKFQDLESDLKNPNYHPEDKQSGNADVFVPSNHLTLTRDLDIENSDINNQTNNSNVSMETSSNSIVETGSKPLPKSLRVSKPAFDLSNSQSKLIGEITTPPEVKQKGNVRISSTSSKRRFDDSSSEEDSDSEVEEIKKPRLVASTPSAARGRSPGIGTDLKPKQPLAPKFSTPQTKPVPKTSFKSLPPKVQPPVKYEANKIKKPILTSLEDLAARGLPDVKDSTIREKKPPAQSTMKKFEDSDSSESESESSDSDSDSSEDEADSKFLSLKKVKEKKKKPSIFSSLKR